MWLNAKAGIDPNEYRLFEKERLSHIQIPTLGIVEQAWAEWCDSRINQKRFPHLLGASHAETKTEVQPPQTREQLEESFTNADGQFDDQAFNRHYLRTLKQRAAAR